MSIIGDVIAGAALLLSAYAMWRTRGISRKQERVLELEQRVHELTLEREARQTAAAEKADVSCSIVRLGSSRFRLKVFNRGKAAAQNVEISFPHGYDLVLEQDVARKFPMRALEPGQSVGLAAVVHMQTDPKHLVHLRWKNADGSEEQKEVEVTI